MKKNFLEFLKNKVITEDVLKDMYEFYLENNPIQTNFDIFLECLRFYNGNFENYIKNRIDKFQILTILFKNNIYYI